MEILSHEIAFIMHDSFRFVTDEEAAREGAALTEQLGSRLGPNMVFKKFAPSHAHYQRMCETPLLDPELERACFRRFNWLKYRANIHRSKLKLSEPEPERIHAIEALLAEAEEVRNHIVRANCRLAMSIVKKFAETPNSFDELLSEGISTLLGAVDKFDFSRGFRFSTYATQSIHRRLFRVFSQRQRQRNRFLNGNTDVLNSTMSNWDVDSDRKKVEGLAQLQQLLSHLELRERLILEARFGLHTSGEKQTFLEIGKKLKISKERVRQLAERALLKLRSLAEEFEFEPAW